MANLTYLFFILETTLPYYAFKNAGFDVKFATEKGDAPECDPVMLRGITQRLLVIPSLFLPLNS